MRELVWKRLTPEAFRKFGTYACMITPSGPHLGGEPIQFFGDMIQSTLGPVPVASFSVCRVEKRPFVINVSEFHDTCCEIVLPLDGDVLMHVAPAGPSLEFPEGLAEVFLVPRGTLACLRPGVWHHAPYALASDAVNCLIVLPERTYKNDCTVYEVPSDRQILIIGEVTR
jgi:ureidoglycolate lyase